MNRSMTTLIAAGVLAAVSALPAFAEDETNVSNGITTAGVPLGLHGVDAVALTTIHDVAEGTARHTVVVNDVAYYFASADTAGRFESAPERYLPPVRRFLRLRGCAGQEVRRRSSLCGPSSTASCISS